MSRHLHIITNSEIEDFRKCRALWGYRNAELLRPLHQPMELNYGSLYHLGCDAGWKGAWGQLEASLETRFAWAVSEAMRAIHEASIAHRAWLEQEATFEQEERREEARVELLEQTEIAQWAVMHYFERRKEDLEMVPLAIEAQFDVAIPTRSGQGHILHQNGKMDLVLWDRQAQQILLHEHKTTGYGVQTYEGRLGLLTQPTGYLRALRILLERAYRDGWEVQLPQAFWGHTTRAVMALMERERGTILGASTGVIAFNVSRRAKPNTPKVNQLRLSAKAAALSTPLAGLYAAQERDGVNRGEVSVADIDTLPEVYQRALSEQLAARGLPITDKQIERLRALESKADGYFHQFEFYRGEAELERWRSEMWVEAKAIRAATRDPLLRTRNPHACTGPGSPKCVYGAVCLAPDDPAARAAFRVATTRHEELSNGDGGHGTIKRAQPSLLGPPSPEPF